MLCRSIFSIPTTTRRSLSTYGQLFQMRKNPTPIVHIPHEIHSVIQWVPPEKMKMWEPQRTGDLKPLPIIDPNWLKLQYRPFTDVIECLPEVHRKIFTVGNGNRRDAINVIMENTLSKVRRHKYDSTSLEASIAIFTIKIRNYQYHLLPEKNYRERKSGHQRIYLKHIIDKRKKYLTNLKNLDYKRFEWIIQILSILYKPKPLKDIRIKRKDCFNALTDMYCEDIIKKKMEVYKAELEGQKIPFLQEKLDTLNKIKEEEEWMRIPCSVEEDIVDTIKRLEILKKSYLDITPTSEQLSP